MITWDDFTFFALPALACWAAGAGAAACRRERAAVWFTALGSAVFAAFICALWSGLERPPLRTAGETRLWYSFFMSLSGLVTFIRRKYRWILAFSTLLSGIFTVVNLLRPEIHDQSLMPALQSPWFVPHVTVYMFSYSVLGCAFLLAAGALLRGTSDYLPTADSLVYTGMAFLTAGMLTGAMWAKSAWGNYWSWDPKETWAAVTWTGYLLYIHLRLSHSRHTRTACLILIVSFLALQMCWYGVNHLPSAAGSIHTYN